MGAWSKLRQHTICVRRGVRYQLDLSQTIDRSLYFYGSWEPETTDFLLNTIKPGDTVIEVGANVGAHSLLMAKAAFPGTVYAFEPTAFAREKLHANLRLNAGISNIEVIPELVTNGNHDIPLRELVSSFKADSSYSPPEITESSGVSIDEFCKTRNISSLKLLKIDVDGYDFKVLQGAVHTIKTLQPVVLTELYDHALRRCGDSVNDILSLFSSLGYSGLLDNGQPIGNAESMNAVFRWRGAE
jgi:FkbM family methyltransferase